MIEPEYKVINSLGKLHPGEVLLEYLDANNWNQRDLARRTGITPKTINGICNANGPITPPTAIVLEKVLRRPAHFWLNLQRQYDEEVARDKVANLPKEWTTWSTKFPIDELKNLGFIPATNDPTEILDSLLTYLGIASPDRWDEIWRAAHVAFRQTRSMTSNIESMSAWVRATEHYAEMLSVAHFDRKAIDNSLTELRKCTTQRMENALENAKTICAACGIAFVVVPSFPKTGISGCARWLSSNKALIAISGRSKTEDQFWFTFFHELAHILLHKKSHGFVLDNAVDNLADKIVDPLMQKQEDEANRFAADTLIPPEYLSDFLSEGKVSNKRILSFAESIEVGPGIVVGRLQHEGLLKYYEGNNFKQRLELNIAQAN